MSLADRAPRCLVTVLTPPGRSAVATVHVEGVDALTLVESCFRPASGKPLSVQAPGRVVFGHWEHGASSREEVIVAKRDGGSIEVHCHGGSAANAAIVQSLVAQGAREGGWDEWLCRRASSPIAGDAWRALADAQTERTARVLLDQHNGSLEQEIQQLIQHVQAGEFRAAIECLENLLVYGVCGQHLTRPWKVVLAGPPNVGKSCLLNAMVGFERTIVYGEPGTTRDAVATLSALQGWPIELVDTAGVRSSRDELELAGMENTRQQLAGAELVLLVDDLRNATRAIPADFGVELARVVLVANKRDLVGSLPPLRSGELAVSALTGEGLDELCQAIVARLIPCCPPPGQAVPFTSAQIEVLREVKRRCQAGELAEAVAALQSLL